MSDCAVIFCAAPAAFVADHWKANRGVPLCDEHARNAIRDGANVVDDAGDQVVPHPETGELAKVVTIEVCS